MIPGGGVSITRYVQNSTDPLSPTYKVDLTHESVILPSKFIKDCKAKINGKKTITFEVWLKLGALFDSQSTLTISEARRCALIRYLITNSTKDANTFNVFEKSVAHQAYKTAMNGESMTIDQTTLQVLANKGWYAAFIHMVKKIFGHKKMITNVEDGMFVDQNAYSCSILGVINALLSITH